MAGHPENPLRVLVLGCGRMGSQIACEYALGGHEVYAVARDRAGLEHRIDRALSMAAEYEVATATAVALARRRITHLTDQSWQSDSFEVVVESAPEDFAVKVSLLEPAARASPQALIATNTSSLSITELGRAIGAGERLVGTHYWSPPLLMPMVEVVSGDETSAESVARIESLLTDLGKAPVVVVREVPGFIWNRLQMALLREALWLVEHGVATPQTIDQVVRDGLARRGRHTGPFETIATGGADVWSATASNLFPVLSNAAEPGDLSRWTQLAPADILTLTERRNRALARELASDRPDRDPP